VTSDNHGLSAPKRIVWPDQLDEQVFLDKYWQVKPLLLRQAFPNFETPLSPDELAGLSLEEDLTPRLIRQDGDGNYSLEHGPFAADRFESLIGNDWSLLVTDVEKHCPELLDFLRPFQFIPNWRIDDLMISYAPKGASVGAHVDEYDVFLLQASGKREWLIDTSINPDLTIAPDTSLKILADFNATERHELLAGDMLYLPPGIPHHGIASSDDCTTWSIGFRAPIMSDVVVAFAELIADRLEDKRYRDPALTVSKPGEMESQTLKAFSKLWKDATNLSDAQIAVLTGRTLTTPQIDVGREVFAETQLAEFNWVKHPFSRFAFINENLSDVTGDVLHQIKESDKPKTENTVTLFVDGQALACSAGTAMSLCANEPVSASSLDERDTQVLQELMLNGCVCPD